MRQGRKDSFRAYSPGGRPSVQPPIGPSAHALRDRAFATVAPAHRSTPWLGFAASVLASAAYIVGSDIRASKWLSDVYGLATHDTALLQQVLAEADALRELVEAGQVSAAKKLNAQMNSLNDQVARSGGFPQVPTEVWPTRVLAAVSILGLVVAVAAMLARFLAMIGAL